MLWGSRRTAWRHGEGGWGCSARVSAPTWPGLGPKPCPGTSSSPSLLSAFAVATYCHFTHRSKGKQAIAASSQNMTLKSDWGEAGDGGAGARGELELCPNEYWNQRLALLSPELKWSPRGATFFHVSWGWCHLPAVRETSEPVLIPPSLSLSFSTSSRSPKAGSRAIAECDGRPARPHFKATVCLLEAGLVPAPWRPGSWGHQLSRTHSGRDPSTACSSWGSKVTKNTVNYLNCEPYR